MEGTKTAATGRAQESGVGLMKAIVQHEFGSADVLRHEEIAVPTPADDQVLIKVHASSVNPADWHMMTGTPYLVRFQAGLRTPKQATAGSDVSGTITAVGKDIVDFAIGDEVFGEINGAFAEFAVAAERHIAPKPAKLTFEEAAAVPLAGLTALQGVRDHAEIQPGQKVLINGASGGVGIYAVQIAKAMGAEVTGVCSKRNVPMVRSLGADHVIDYTAEDFADHAGEYDVMIDNIGNRSLSDCRGVLKDGGTYLMIGGPKKNWLGPVLRMLAAKLSFQFSSQKMKWFVANVNQPDLIHLKELVDGGQLVPVIDRSYQLAEVPDAMRYLAEGHTAGKSVIAVHTEIVEEN